MSITSLLFREFENIKPAGTVNATRPADCND